MFKSLYKYKDDSLPRGRSQVTNGCFILDHQFRKMFIQKHGTERRSSKSCAMLSPVPQRIPGSRCTQTIVEDGRKQ